MIGIVPALGLVVNDIGQHATGKTKIGCVDGTVSQHVVIGLPLDACLQGDIHSLLTSRDECQCSAV